MKNLQHSNDANRQSDAVSCNTETKNRKSHCSIYEDFINRVQPLNSNKQGENSSNSDGFTRISLLEPLNEKELLFLTNSIEDSSTYRPLLYISESESESESDNIVPVIDLIKTKNKTDYRNSQPLKPLIHKNPRVSTEKTASNISWLATGLVCGLLLSIAIIFILDKTGLLPTLSQSIQSNHIIEESRVEGNKGVAISEEQRHANPQNKPEIPAERITQSLPLTPATSKQSMETAQPHITSNPSISIDDFREEAQSTLYREIKD